MLKLLIADSAEDFRLSLADVLKSQYAVHTCGDGDAALELVRSFAPDLIVLDLALPGTDGLSVVQLITKSGNRPSILATTRFLSDYVLEACSRMGVDYMMVKPCSIRAIASRLSDIAAGRNPQQRIRQDPQASVANLLLTLGISTNCKGYTYLREAIPLYAKDPCQMITKELYPAVAKAFGARSAQVERAMRTAVEKAWLRRDDQIWRLYFTPDAKGIIAKPSNSAFISRLAGVLQQQSS